MQLPQHIAIIEDEKLAYEKLVGFVRKVAWRADIHWLRSVVDLERYLEKYSPDILFSDIELLDGNVFELLDRYPLKCPIIFSTAYNAYFQKAFTSNGIAYLLKPYSEEEFLRIWNKYETLFSGEHGKIISDLNKIMRNKGEGRTYRNTYLIKKRSGVHILQIQEVAYFQAQGDFVFAVDQQQQKHIINKSLRHIQLELDPKDFFQINRSEIVNINFIIQYRPYVKNRVEVILRTMESTLITSNSRAQEFKLWLDR
ncbi:LytR/AlgR family response regulator transcription factor [Spongiimicrobium salis]|uniref:LytR/AlgR family response regulator transcription factor n=1 Tax=Spongiimicrobium salis TaxID=1667022 RepID=UPI00374DE9B6